MNGSTETTLVPWYVWGAPIGSRIIAGTFAVFALFLLWGTASSVDEPVGYLSNVIRVGLDRVCVPWYSRPSITGAAVHARVTNETG
jgi:hypothetical protein